MAGGEFKVTGDDIVLKTLDAVAERFAAQLPEALRAELEIEATESQQRTPVDTGALRRSTRVTVDGQGRETVGTIAVGGPAAPYAVYVHENLSAHHPIGQAKFLESTITESAPFLAARIAKRVELG